MMGWIGCSVTNSEGRVVDRRGGVGEKIIIIFFFISFFQHPPKNHTPFFLPHPIKKIPFQTAEPRLNTHLI